MALISKMCMTKLFLVATLHFISLSSSTKFQAHARGRQFLFIDAIFASPYLYKWLAGKGVDWAMNQLPKMTDNPNAKGFLYNMRDGYEAGKKLNEYWCWCSWVWWLHGGWSAGCAPFNHSLLINDGVIGGVDVGAHECGGFKVVGLLVVLLVIMAH